MKNIKPIVLEKYNDEKKFKLMGNGIYKNLSDENYRIALSLELEDDENNQYPIGDIMDKYFVNATNLIESKVENGIKVLNIELECSLRNTDKNLENITKLSKIIGKRVYNKKNENGQIELIIE